MDIVADAVVDTARLKDNLPLSINVVHPRPIAWTTLITFIRNALVSQGKSELGLVPWSEWLRDLAAQDQSKLDEYVSFTITFCIPLPLVTSTSTACLEAHCVLPRDG